MNTFERSIGKWPLNCPSLYHSILKCLFFEIKEVNSTFCKGVGRLVDRDSQECLWFEVTGGSVGEVRTRSQMFFKGKAGTFRKLMIKKSSFYSGGRVVSLNPGRDGASCVPMPAAHPDYNRFLDAAAPEQKIGKLLECLKNQRVDVIGKITAMELKRSNTGLTKHEVWLKGDDGCVVLVEMWGRTFSALLERAVVGESVLQVENARVVVANDNGTVSLSAEFFLDGERGAAWAFLDPPHRLTEVLKQVTSEAGQRISSVWESGNRVVSKLEVVQGLKFKCLMSTLRASCLAWNDPGAAGTADRLPAQVELVGHSVFVTELQNATPVYRECKICRTKVNSESGLCKNRGVPHVTVVSDEKKALSSVRLADASGSFADVLADGPVLCALAGVANVEQLDALLQKRGAAAVIFRNRYDFVLAANQRKKSLGAGKENRPLLAGKENQTLSECRFEVVRVQPTLLEPWDTPERPALLKVIDTEEDPATGHVFPVRCPTTDLTLTPGGVKCTGLKVFPQFIAVMGYVKDKPRERRVGEGEDALVEIVHSKVFPVESDVEGDAEVPTFVVEIVGAEVDLEVKRMPKERPYLIVGEPVMAEGVATVTIVAENIFDLQHIPDARARFAQEREGWWKIMGSDDVERRAKKRSAEHLTIETPSKVQCQSI